MFMHVASNEGISGQVCVRNDQDSFMIRSSVFALHSVRRIEHRHWMFELHWSSFERSVPFDRVRNSQVIVSVTNSRAGR